MALPHTELKDVLLAQMRPQAGICIMFVRTLQRCAASICRLTNRFRQLQQPPEPVSFPRNVETNLKAYME
jgi:hypothetical protein